MKKLNEECGISAIYNRNNLDIGRLLYYSLYALQHRGQESCGIAVNKCYDVKIDEQTVFYKDTGLVNEVFNDDNLKSLQGIIGIAHTRYSTTGTNSKVNAQPLVAKYRKGNLSIAHNGNISNAQELREELEEQGMIFQTSNDTEIILFLLARQRLKTPSIEQAVSEVIPKLKGSFSLVIMSPKKLIAVRDPYGIRPLCMGKIEDSVVFASESCALVAMCAEFERDVKPGEIVVVHSDRVESIETYCNKKTALCIFEHLYFARPDSVIDGQSVYEARFKAGKLLAINHNTPADIVIGVPDSGTVSAMGYSEQSGIQFGLGLIKNNYIGRTFIAPSQEMRQTNVSIKLSPLSFNIKGKRVILVDDSIVRGTTIAHIVEILKKAGALEVHIRICAPEFLYPCFFGTDIGSREELISNSYNPEKLCKKIGATSLGFLSLTDLTKIAQDSNVNFCNACFSGNYPFEVPKQSDKFKLNK